MSTKKKVHHGKKRYSCYHADTWWETKCKKSLTEYAKNVSTKWAKVDCKSCLKTKELK